MKKSERMIEILDRLLEVEPKIPLRIDLWSASEIALYLKQTRRNVSEHTTKLPGFPQAIYLPTRSGKGRSHPLWKAQEVIGWTEKYQERRAA